MATYGLNSGQDCTVDISNDQTGATYSFSTIGADLMHFEAGWDTDIIRRRPISNNGLTKRRIEYKGTKGTIEVGRINADFETLEIGQQDNYRQGGDPYTYTINQMVKNRDGSGTQVAFVFLNCTVWISKGAAYKMGEDVTLTLEFEGDDASQP